MSLRALDDAHALQLERARSAEGPEAVLDALLAAWRARPLVETAELVELVSRRAAVRGRLLVASRAASLEDAQAEWLGRAAAGRAIDLPRLVDAIVTPRRALSIQRLRRLDGWPADPRLAPALLALAAQRPLTSRPARPFWTAFFTLLERRADARLAPRVAALLEAKPVTEFDLYLAGKLRGVEALVAALPPPPTATPTERAALDAVAARLEVARERRDGATADELLAAVWRDPDDDGPRAVYADWLCERDDPRGEFINLQLARAREPASLRRERALLAEHGRAWMGAIEPAVHTSAFRFERGFLAACRVAWRKLAASPRLMTHPSWSTVREYELDPAGEASCDPWLDHMIALGAKRR
jgi:uncharacterized protein (TIGR02996 family)